MSDLPNLDQSAAKFLDAIREGSTASAVQINELAAKGYFVDGIGSMICAAVFIAVAIWLAKYKVPENNDFDDSALVFIKWLGVIICFILSVIIFGCSFTQIFAPDTVLIMKFASKIS